MTHAADPNCPSCGGRGFLYPECLLTLPGQRGGRYCDCALAGLRLANMERIWESLSQAKDLPRKRSALVVFVERNLWVTSDTMLFRSHLRAVANEREVSWDARVAADSQLLDSWLGTAKAQGAKIFDVEVENARLSHLTLPDLAEPPRLLIVLLGVKQLANREAPNALLEALALRRHLGRPTWLVDQPNNRIEFSTHRFHSDTLLEWLAEWPHVEISGNKVRPMKASTVAASPIDDILDPTLVREEGASGGTRSYLEQVNVEPSKPRKAWGRKRP